MSYNGIGLQTPRGSGTNGHISRNLGSIRRREPFSVSQAQSEPQFEKRRQADLGILQHEAKRKMQNRLLIFRDSLEAQSPALSEDEINAKVAEEKSRIEAEMLQELTTAKGRIQHKAYETHDIVVSKEAEMKTLRGAFGVREDYEEGQAMKRRDQDASVRKDTDSKEDGIPKRDEPKGRREVYDPTLEKVRNPLDRRIYGSRGPSYSSTRRASDRSDVRGRRKDSRLREDRWRHERTDFRARGRGYSPAPRRTRDTRRRDYSRSRSSSARPRRRIRYSRSVSSSRSPRRSISRSRSPVRDSRRRNRSSSPKRSRSRRRRSISSASRSRSVSRSRTPPPRRNKGRSSPIRRRGRRDSRSVSPVSRSRSSPRRRSISSSRSNGRNHARRDVSKSPRRDRERRATRSLSSRSSVSRSRSSGRQRNHRDRQRTTQRGRSRSRSPRKRGRRSISPKAMRPVSPIKAAVAEPAGPLVDDGVPAFDRRKALGID